MLQLTQISPGVFDVTVDTAADINQAAATVVYATLMTDARAPAGRVSDGDRGWWLNPQAGCGLWHVRRQALSADARREAIEMVRRALAAHAPALSGVVVKDVGTAGNVSAVVIEVSGQHNGRTFSVGLTL